MSTRTESTPASLLVALQSHLWFASCPPVLQQALIDRSRLWYLKPGEVLFSRGGEAHDGLCCVVAGAMKLGSTNPKDGSHSLTLYVEPYHWFGEIALIDRLPRGQDAVADMDSTVLVASRTAMESWLDEHPQYWRDIARLACGKLRLMLTALEDNATLSIEQRLARRLLYSATNFGQSTQPVLRRHVRLPQEYLARMLGVSRQTVNKALRALAREQILALHYAEVEILDVLGLLQKAGSLESLLGQTAAGGSAELSAFKEQAGLAEG